MVEGSLVVVVEAEKVEAGKAEAAEVQGWKCEPA